MKIPADPRSPLAAVASCLWASFRETLPSTEGEAGPFVAGMAYAFVIHWSLLIAITWAHCATKGGC